MWNPRTFFRHSVSAFLIELKADNRIYTVPADIVPGKNDRRRDFVDDKQEQTIEKYGFLVKNRYRVRGAVLLDTGEGLRMLRQYSKIGEHFAFENRVKEELAKKGMRMTDRVVCNLEGERVTEWESGEKYVVYEWFPGNECDYRNSKNLCRAAANLGQLHLAMRGMADEAVPAGELLSERYSRRGREMKRVYRFMKEKKRKSRFELYALACYPEFAKKAEAAEKKLAQSAYYLANGRESKDLCHGEYNYHNIIFTPDGVATTNFERMYYGMQLMDLAYFFRKIMEKNSWDAEKGNAVLESYREIAGLSREEKEFLWIVLSYPEKYWKLMNHYMNGKKTWISDKNTEKLRVVREQEEAKEHFLTNGF